MVIKFPSCELVSINKIPQPKWNYIYIYDLVKLGEIHWGEVEESRIHLPACLSNGHQNF